MKRLFQVGHEKQQLYELTDKMTLTQDYYQPCLLPSPFNLSPLVKIDIDQKIEKKINSTFFFAIFY
jgi:hypothetical protein